MSRQANLRAAGGFTLVEMIIVIVIAGVLSAMVAVFIKAPVDGYVDSVRRAELTDTADVALRRLSRDIRRALPNSVRVMNSASMNYIEFIMTSAGGRYRDPVDGSTAGDFLSFSTLADVTFDVLGPPPEMAVGDFLVVYNLGPGYTPADAYNCTGQCNRAQIRIIAGNNVTMVTNPFANQTPPLPSPGARFQVVPGGERAVTYACSTVSGQLTRHWNYGFNPAQQVPAGGSSAVLADGARCTVDYVPAAFGRNGLLYISLTLTRDDESVTLFNQIHVDNTP